MERDVKASARHILSVIAAMICAAPVRPAAWLVLSCRTARSGLEESLLQVDRVQAGFREALPERRDRAAGGRAEIDDALRFERHRRQPLEQTLPRDGMQKRMLVEALLKSPLPGRFVVTRK